MKGRNGSKPVNHYKLAAILHVAILTSYLSAVYYSLTAIPLFGVLGFFDLLREYSYPNGPVLYWTQLVHYVAFIYLGILLHRQKALRWNKFFSPYGWFLIIYGVIGIENLNLLLGSYSQFVIMIYYLLFGVLIILLLLSLKLPGSKEEKSHQHTILFFELLILVAILVVGFGLAQDHQLEDRLIQSVQFYRLNFYFPDLGIFIALSIIFFVMLPFSQPLTTEVNEERELQFPTSGSS